MHGSIHGNIGNLVSLSVLAMDYNYFSGSVPNEIGKLQMLQDCSFVGGGEGSEDGGGVVGVNDG
ncbi:unnamed protein product [Prunus brigantina]